MRAVMRPILSAQWLSADVINIPETSGRRWLQSLPAGNVPGLIIACWFKYSIEGGTHEPNEVEYRKRNNG